MSDKVFVFIITFFNYASLHGSRTLWSNVQDNLYAKGIDNYDKVAFGYVNLCFLFVYAITMKMYISHQKWWPICSSIENKKLFMDRSSRCWHILWLDWSCWKNRTLKLAFNFCFNVLQRIFLKHWMAWLYRSSW